MDSGDQLPRSGPPRGAAPRRGRISRRTASLVASSVRRRSGRQVAELALGPGVYLGGNPGRPSGGALWPGESSLRVGLAFQVGLAQEAERNCENRLAVARSYRAWLLRGPGAALRLLVGSRRRGILPPEPSARRSLPVAIPMAAPPAHAASLRGAPQPGAGRGAAASAQSAGRAAQPLARTPRRRPGRGALSMTPDMDPVPAPARSQGGIFHLAELSFTRLDGLDRNRTVVIFAVSPLEEHG